MSLETTGSLKGATWKETSVVGTPGFIENDAAGNFSFGNVGSVGSSNWAHIETKTLLADTDTLIFSGLNGDTQEIYKLVYHQNHAPAGVPSRAWEIRPNGFVDESDNSMPQVLALGVFGADLIAGGLFGWAGGFGNVYASNIARWSGTSWSALGSGVSAVFGAVSPVVRAVVVYGGNLIVAGDFTLAGGASANRIASWDGSSWSTLGTGMNDRVRALAVIGGDLYATGDFTTAGGTSAIRVAKWNGSVWSALGTGLSASGRALAALGTDLYAGGSFTTAGGTAANHIAKWNGTVWSALGAGAGAVGTLVGALTTLGADLYVGGTFLSVGNVVVGDTAGSGVARWDGAAWFGLGPNSGFPSFLTGVSVASVSALATFSGDVIAGGAFSTAGGIPPLSGTGTVATANIARWIPSTTGWAALSTGTNGPIGSLASFGGQVYAGGAGTSFDVAGGVDPTVSIARWNGTSWSAVAGGVSGLSTQQSTTQEKTTSAGEAIVISAPPMRFHRGSAMTTGFFSGILYFYAKSGKSRNFFSNNIMYLISDATTVRHIQSWGHWSNTTDNITSLTLKEISGQGNGFTTGSKWSLYRVNRA